LSSGTASAKARVDVCFNTRVVAHRWRLIDSIEDGEVDVDASLVGEHGKS
jgi:hypothetical protein